MTIKSLKLVSGEELVVEITEESTSGLTFKNPVACVIQRTEKGPLIGFTPWMSSGDGPFTISFDKIITSTEVAQEVKNGYNQIFGSGIVVPIAKDLILG